MAKTMDLLDHESPDLRTLILHPRSALTTSQPAPRRSPRKAVRNAAAVLKDDQQFSNLQWMATSEQRLRSPAKPSPSKQPSTSKRQSKNSTAVGTTSLRNIPILPKANVRRPLSVTTGNRLSPAASRSEKAPRLLHADSFLLPLANIRNSPNGMDDSDSEPSFVLGQVRPKNRKRSGSTRSVMSLMTEAARNAPMRSSPAKATRPHVVKGKSKSSMNTMRASRFVLDEAECLQDLAESDGNDNGDDEEEDTDLSGFIVDDDAELSYHESLESGSDTDNEQERKERRERRKRDTKKTKPKRRLQRGRPTGVFDTDEEVNNAGGDLADILGKMRINEPQQEHSNVDQSGVEVVDLVSPNHPSCPDIGNEEKTGTKLFEKLNALRLDPPESIPTLKIMSNSILEDPFFEETRSARIVRPTTPTVTPPRSPTKLKSPSKLFSPSKRGDIKQRSPHRQSTDAFWDHNTINSWNDQFSPKKAPLTSPRKGLKFFDVWSDSEIEGDDSTQKLEESSDGLPSPCESPTKARTFRSPIKSPEKAAKQKLQEERKPKIALKKKFDSEKESMALELLDLLDKHITNGQISKMATSTGGVKIIWSKTLRSTAGRANWKKTRSVTGSSPTKQGVKIGVALGDTDNTIQHFASIELAIKIIDRPERLYDTLAHEFCHLANFMVSGIIDQPHGVQFQNWASKTTQWMRCDSGRSEWATIKITTKHSYVIEHKYLWVCTGRSTKAGMMSGGSVVDDEDKISDDGCKEEKQEQEQEQEQGCGAEYGRHSKSIDTEKHRCGVCKGVLLQIRPKPRTRVGMRSGTKSGMNSETKTKLASGVRDSPKKVDTLWSRGTIQSLDTKNVIKETVREIEVIELSD